MRRRQLMICLLTSCIWIGAPLAQDKVILVGMDVEAKPFDFVEDGKYVGFDQDLIAEIAKDVGFRYQVTAMDWPAVIPAIQTANIDMAASAIFITEARKKVVDFSDPYYMSAVGAIVKKDNMSIQTGKDIDGKRVAAVTGSLGAIWVKQNAPNAQVIFFSQIARVCHQLSQTTAAARCIAAKKFRAVLSYLVAMARYCFRRAKKFSIRCLALYRCLS